MANFYAWGTVPRSSLTDLRAFLAAESPPVTRFLDRYRVWTTSGTSGEPGIYLHDSRALSVYYDLTIFRA